MDRARVAAALVLVALVGAASASRLVVDAGSLSVATAVHPCPGTAAAAPEDPHGSQKYDDVRVALPAGCAGRLQVAVIENGAQIGSYDDP